MLVPCFHCNCLVEDFTTSSYRLVAGGPKVGRVCADCANGERDTVLNAHPTFKVAEKQLCICPRHLKNVVYIDSISGEGTEFDSLEGYYCINCNSFWREP